MSLLEVRGLDVFYGSVQALRSIDVFVEEGERVALIGPNGAGKSTTLRAVSGLVPPRAGQILLDGQPIQGLPAHRVVEQGVAHAPEGRHLFPSLSVEENLRFGYLPRRKDPAGYESALEGVFEYFPRLRERRAQAAGTLSGGEQQMLVVARALMSSPRLLMVDEFSLGLAPKIVSLLFEIVEEVHRRGTAVLIVEQFVHLALRHTDRAYVLAKGEVVLEGPSREVEGRHEILASYLGAEATPAPSEVPKRPGKTSPRRSRR